MAINRITGVMLEDDLLRDGSNLAIETNLLYVDVNSSNIGIKTATPETELDIIGSLKINELIITGNTLTNRLADGFVFDLANNDIDVNQSHIVDLADPVNNSDAATKLYVDQQVGGSVTDRIIEGASRLKITDIGAGTSLDLTASNQSILILSINETDANFETNLSVNDSLNVNGSSNLNNVLIFGSTVTTTGLSGADLTITSNSGTIILSGDVQHSGTSSNRVMYTDVNNIVTSNPSLTFDGNALVLNGIGYFDNVILDGNSVSSTTTLNLTSPDTVVTGTNSVNINTLADKDITLTTSNDGKVIVQATTSLTIPSGTTAERPTVPQQGDIRFNQNLNHPEIYDGFVWTQFSPEFVGMALQVITPDGISNSYVLDQSATSISVFVSLNGIIQTPEVAYTVAGTTITFIDVPLTTDIISIRFLASITTVTSITDSLGDTIVEAVTSEIHMDVAGIRRITITENFTEVSTTVLPDSNLGRNLGAPNRQFNNFHVKTVASDFVGDNIYSVGTVMIAGGLNEVQNSSTYADPAVVGVVSFDDATTSTTIAMSGKAICSVEGSVSKGDLLTSSNTSGTAIVLNPIDYVPGCVIGKSLQDFAGPAGFVNIIVTIF